MATLRDIKRKISSIQSTQTITRTMKMVSASKLRKAQEEMEKVSAYAVKMEELTKRIAPKLPEGAHPLLVEKEETKRILIVSVASDRGLCGAFNINIGLQIERFIAENRDNYDRIGVYVFGRKLKDYLQRRKVDVVKNWVDVKSPDYDVVNQIVQDLTEYYTSGEFDKIYLLYTHYHSPVKQLAELNDFIPVRIEEAETEEGPDYLYEPDINKIADALIPRYIATRIYYALVQSQTSEHAARMSAMENATSNCGEMIRELTLVYNKTRQESITNEMMDIVGGAEALRGT